jgi:starch phosphorylase
MPNYNHVLKTTTPNLDNGLAYAAWHNKMGSAWKQVHIRNVTVAGKQVKVGTDVEVEAEVSLGPLTPDDVRVQLYYGSLNTRGEIGMVGDVLDMQPSGKNGKGEYTFAARVTYTSSGERGLSVRVVPYHEYLRTPFLRGLITWA